MKKCILCLMSLLFSGIAYSQDDEWYWNESTKDAVYEAANSKFVKKWCTPSGESGMPDDYLILNANGTFKLIRTMTHPEISVPFTTTMSGSWKRVEKMTLMTTITNVTIAANQKDLAKLSARKRDENQKMIKYLQTITKPQFVGKKTYNSIYRIDEDHLILSDGGYWRSERLRKKELDSIKVEETKKVEEANRAE